MKRLLCAVIVICLTMGIVSLSSAGMFSFGLHRDSACLNQRIEAPCIFPPVNNPCAVPCRLPGLQKQAVPCAFETACPSLRLPCHGVSYGNNPYPIFK